MKHDTGINPTIWATGEASLCNLFAFSLGTWGISVCSHMNCIFTVHSYQKWVQRCNSNKKKKKTIEMQMIFLVNPGEWVLRWLALYAHKLQYKYTIFLPWAKKSLSLFSKGWEDGDCKMCTQAMALERLIRCIWQNMAFDLDANFYYCWCIYTRKPKTQLPTLLVAHDTHTHTYTAYPMECTLCIHADYE